MNSFRKNPWLNVWMLVFAAFGLWVMITKLTDIATSPGTPWYREAVSVILLIFVAGVALWKLPAFFGSEEEGSPHRSLIGIWHVYVNAWKQLWGQKWLRWFFGIFFGVRILGGLLENLLTYHYLGAAAKNAMQIMLNSPNKPDVIIFRALLPDWLGISILNSLRDFSPLLYAPLSFGGLAAVSIALIIIAVKIYPKLQKLSDDPVYARGANILRKTIFPFTTLMMASSAFSIYFYILQSYLLRISPKTNPYQSLPGYFGRLSVIITIIVSILALFLNSSIFAGFVGSLIRGKQGKSVDTDTFIKDIIRYIKPSISFYILFLIISTLFGLVPHQYRLNSFGGGSIPSTYTFIASIIEDLLMILLMFVPYAMVSGINGIKQEIGKGIKLLTANIGEVATFIALGLIFLTVSDLFIQILRFILPGSIVLNLTNNIILSIFNITVNVIVTAVMALAVWELFMRFRTGTDIEPAESVSVMSPD